MIKLLLRILRDERGGLGIVFGSIISAVADKTGDDSVDAVVKIKRLINEKGPEFCMITNWPFLRSNISITLTTTAYAFSGASYLPATFKRVVAAYLLDGTDRYDLTEVSVKQAYEWANPEDNTGRPDEFCITRVESGYWEIQFNHQPDDAYVVYMDIELQWTDLSTTTDESIITKPYYPAFSHFVSMDRYIQQGDTENFVIAERKWWNPMNPKASILGNILSSISNPLKRKRVVVNMEQAGEVARTFAPDYTERVY